MIAITGRPESTLAVEADVHLDAAVEKEACPLNLAPTASTTATLALGDALAVALLDARGFKSDDFAMHHPAGALGRRLLVHVGDIMRKGEQLPRSRPVTGPPAARHFDPQAGRAGHGYQGSWPCQWRGECGQGGG